MADLVPVPGVMLARLAALGLDVAQILARAGVSSAEPGPPRGRLTTAEFFAVWQAIEALADAPDLGLRLGAEALAQRFDRAALAALHAADVGDALAKLGRFRQLECPEEVTVTRVDDEARVRCQWLLAERDPPRLLVDATFASMLALLRRGTRQPIAPRRVELTRRRADAALLVRHFGCPVQFEAPTDLLVLPAAALAEPFVRHEAELLALLLPGLEVEPAANGQRRPLADEARLAMCRCMCGERPSVEKVARDLRVSPRTLQRRLEAAGTNYQQLLDEVREQAARRLLTRTELDAGLVAFLLGFEELNSFTRAFQRWAGTTPTRYRAQARAS
ncbi:AraC family transcriptional regulator [Nannocystis bainbridge]|uniref:AraC family transcriptional regulator ligand-binding domain-containing protein n=1 Tax=Nannocystis bainbridge TaxID=2995303 RepID=A0ABT5E4E5_9BACT|nr:AraC family transcriptional regulator [Nannocystis bainbridge]MDC0720742.1 AraC family transcriptional regulator ligand-binding domain-containing protein [Nannocystis bainbridge]